MNNAQAAVSASPHAAASLTERFEFVGLMSMFGVGALLQLSIAASQILLTVAVFCWLAVLIVDRERLRAPGFFWPLVIYAALTLVSAAFSIDRRTSLIDCKQLVLFLIVPITYRFVTGTRTATMLTVALSVGAASAAFGIFQYGLLHYDYLGQRPRGLLGHYMTYSGLLMLVFGIGIARLLFGMKDRLWPALVMPALAVTLALTQTRSAWIGACAGAAVLFTLKDFRLFAVLPIVLAIGFIAAPAVVSQRFTSLFDPADATRRDRGAMLREGAHMIAAHPLVGVGPNMVEAVYEQYRDPGAVQKVNPHLHNVPVQIAAERGIPALLAWIVFVVVLTRDLWRRFRSSGNRVVTAAAIAAVAGMLAAGLLEYNFGDSEFLMLFLILITLPFTPTAPPREFGAAA
jgi:putative inorganic carbon (HCO3(-)) transporter